MKKMNLLKSILVLFVAFTFSMCEESGEIQFVVEDDFPNEIAVNGLEGETSYTISDSADISELLDGAAKFVEADIKTVTLQLKDYSGSAINGNVRVKTGSLTLFDQAVNLTSTPTVITVPENASDILSAINSGTIAISLEGEASAPIEDNSFIIIVTVKVRGTVE